MTHKKYIVLIMCCVAVTANARQIITGSLSNKETTKPVEGANVELLLLPDSSVIETVKTSSDGLFALNKSDTAKAYCLRVKHLAHKITVVPVPSRKKGLINSVGVISLEPETFQLKDIVVNGTKVSVTELGDRTIYGIPEGFQKTSRDGLDVIRKIPAVQVDYLNEDITVNGKTNVKIEVDGVTRDKGYLKRLHPSQISKMEVITSPSGKYDADVDAVINIITNPAMRYGLKGMASLAAFPISSDSYLGSMSASLDYGLKKISYYASGYGVANQFDLSTDMTRLAGTTDLERNGVQTMENKMAHLNVGFIWDPDELNELDFNVSYDKINSKNNGDSWDYLKTGNASSISRTLSNSDTNNDGLKASLFYKHKYDKNTQHGLEAELNYYNNLGSKSTTDFQNISYDLADTSEVYRSAWLKEITDTKVQTISGQTNYTLPFDSVYSFNAGVSFNYDKYTTDNTSFMAVVNNMDYSDLRIGAYAELSRNFRKGSLKFGSRFETSRVVINSSDPHRYTSPLPYVNAFYKISGDKSIKLAYSRRVIRPSSSQLNPFVSVVDSQTISRGNLDLKPAYRDNFQLTYDTKVTIKKVTFNLSPQLFYEKKQQLIQNILSRNTVTNLFESVPTNISDGYETGGSLSLNSQIGKVMLNSNFRYSFNHIDRYLDQIEATDQRNWNWNTFAMYTLPLQFQFFTMAQVSGPVMYGQSVVKSAPLTLFGLSKQVKSHNISLLMFNPFAENFFKNETTIRSESIYQKQNVYMNQNCGILLAYQYTFKVGKSVERKKRTVEENIQNSIMRLPGSF